MDRDDLIKLARDAGFDPHDMSADFTCNLTDIERFAALVAAAEREACAKVCEQYGVGCFNNDDIICDVCADLIRARGRV